MTVEVWDLVSGNVAAVYDTQEEAVAALDAFLKRWPNERRSNYAIRDERDETEVVTGESEHTNVD